MADIIREVKIVGYVDVSYVDDPTREGRWQDVLNLNGHAISWWDTMESIIAFSKAKYEYMELAKKSKRQSSWVVLL